MNQQTPPIDVQSQIDYRHLKIDEVGVRDLRYPINIAGGNGLTAQSCSARFYMTVMLPAEQKGTHMSRFVELLEEYRAKVFDAKMFRELFEKMLIKLTAEQGRLEVSFEFYVDKLAPVTKVKSLMDYEGGWSIEKNTQSNNEYLEKVWVKAPVTSLCPCSKTISDYGAHNQRSHLTLSAQPATNLEITMIELVQIAEQEASCELYGILKRPDEKFITERAYDNPKFVEDLVRDVAIRMRDDKRIQHYQVIAENFESIHNHSAYAIIRG